MGHSDGGVQRRYRHQLEHQLSEDAARLEAWIAGAIEGKIVALPQADALHKGQNDGVGSRRRGQMSVAIAPRPIDDGIV